jgi:hypothetical protein
MANGRRPRRSAEAAKGKKETEMTMRTTKLRCGYQDGMSAFEPPETEAAAARRRHTALSASRSGALALRCVIVFEECAGPSAPDGSVVGGRAQFGDGVRDLDRSTFALAGASKN